MIVRSVRRAIARQVNVRHPRSLCSLPGAPSHRWGWSASSHRTSNQTYGSPWLIVSSAASVFGGFLFYHSHSTQHTQQLETQELPRRLTYGGRRRRAALCEQKSNGNASAKGSGNTIGDMVENAIDGMEDPIKRFFSRGIEAKVFQNEDEVTYHLTLKGVDQPLMRTAFLKPVQERVKETHGFNLDDLSSGRTFSNAFYKLPHTIPSGSVVTFVFARDRADLLQVNLDGQQLALVKSKSIVPVIRESLNLYFTRGNSTTLEEGQSEPPSVVRGLKSYFGFSSKAKEE